MKSSETGSCDVLRVIYDLSGRRLYEQVGGAGGTTRRFVGEHFVFTKNGSNGQVMVRSEAFAWGERVAYIDVETTPASGAAIGTWRFDEDLPPWALALPPLVLLAVGFGFALRGGLLVGVARRPGHAALSSVIIVSLVVPAPAFAGGGTERLTITRWVLSDRLGSSVFELDAAGLAMVHTRFKPFGRMEYETGPEAASAKRVYAGHREQKETGFVYMNARWQDPATGTFLSVDPVLADIADPQALNAYAYARNNPVNVTDPTGMCGVGPLGIASWGCVPNFANWAGSGFSNSGLKNSFDLRADGSPRGPRESGSSYTTNQNAGFEGTLEAIYDGKNASSQPAALSQYASAGIETDAQYVPRNDIETITVRGRGSDGGRGDLAPQEAGFGAVIPWLLAGARAGVRYIGTAVLWAGLRFAPALVPLSQLQRLTPAQYKLIFGSGPEGAQRALAALQRGVLRVPDGLSMTRVRSGLEWYSRQLQTHPNSIRPGNTNALRQQFINEFNRQGF